MIAINLAALAALVVGFALAQLAVPALSGFVKWYKAKFNKRRVKPFDCEYCLAGWFAMIAAFVFGTGPVVLVLVGIASLLITAKWEAYKLEHGKE